MGLSDISIFFYYSHILGFIVFCLGLAAGSFLNVVIYRLPRREQGLSPLRPKRSFCPACGAAISWYDNIPLLSWLILNGRCRRCRRPISIRYPLTELMAGGLTLYLFTTYNGPIPLLIQTYFAFCLLAIALIDLELMVIPTALLYPTAALGLLAALVWPDPDYWAGPWLRMKLEPALGLRLTSLAGAALGLALGWGALKAIAAVYQATRKMEGLGDGDPPLLGLIGIFMGWRALPLVILCSSFLGLLAVPLLMVVKRRSRPAGGWGLYPLPFGPFLVLGAFIYFAGGQDFMAWYWSLSD